jgi:hypothetical protein
MKNLLLIFAILAITGCAQDGLINRIKDGHYRPPKSSVEEPAQNEEKVYREPECVGAVVNGVCHGTIIEDGGNHPTCHGEMINGQCTGPMF